MFGVKRDAARALFIIATRLVRWRLLLSSPLGGPDNMALDEALMRRARRTGEWVLRVYGWSTPTLSLGRNQKARGHYDERALARAGVEVVRRPTGGRALLHHHEVTYSVTGPAPVSPVGESYDRITLLLVHALRSLGVQVTPARPTQRQGAPSLTPCFAEPAEGELVVAGRKLVASAQWRDGGALLQHGSILLDDDQRDIPALMRAPLPAPPPAATLRDALGRAPSLEEVADALFAAVRQREDPEAVPLVPEAGLLDDARGAARSYRDPAWTWRR
jgi:lipoate-protein ligase A